MLQRLTFVAAAGKNRHGHPLGLFACTCGGELVTLMQSFRKGKTRSCGCLQRESRIVHGQYLTPEYKVWCGMKSRCYLTTHVSFPDYGGRGIAICDSWMNSFASFLSDMGPRPSSRHSIERGDSNGNYCPGNCRWATRKEQQRNLRSNRMVEIGGKSKTLAEWSEISGLDVSTPAYRLRSKVSPENLLVPAGAMRNA